MERARINAFTVVMVVVIGKVLLNLPKVANAQSADDDVNSMYKRTLEKYHSEEFDEAIQIAQAIREKYPDEPAGPFGLLTTYQTIMWNYRVRLHESKVDSLLDLSIKLAKKAVKKNRKEAKNYFYLGCAYGFRSILRAQQKKWMDAFKDGSQVLKNFNIAVAHSPEFYDSYYGLGLYKYWLGAKGAMRYLPFAKRNRNQGIEQMRLAIEKGQFLKVNAMYGLMAVFQNEGEYEQALQVSNVLFEMYPNNPTLNYRRGKIFQALEGWPEAIESFQNLHDILMNTKYKSTSYQIECLYQLAQCNYQLENYWETQRLCQNAIILEEYLDFSKELDGPLEKFSEIKDKLHKLNDEVKSIILARSPNQN